MIKLALAATALTMAVASCSTSSNQTADAAPRATAVDAGGVPADAMSDGFTTWLSRSWTLPAGATDIYRCVRIQLDHDTVVTGLRALAPFGAHHSVLTVSPPDAPLGDYDCSSGSLDQQVLFGAGVATNDLIYPDGVGMKLAAGTKINLNLHLFNATDSEISGVSGVLIREGTNVTSYADLVFGGKVNFAGIPNNGETTDVVGTCTLATDYTVFDLFPHMHQIATHQKVEWLHDGASSTLLDDDFSFSSQKNYPLAAPIQMHAGDQIKTTCSYVNNLDHVVNWGDKSTDEMCITGIYRYPASGGAFECFNQ